MPFLYSCQVRKGLTMGSCFLPPFSGTCSGIPSGCGSCVSQCSNGKGPSKRQGYSGGNFGGYNWLNY